LPGLSCPVCARENPPAAAFCFACGAFLSPRAEVASAEEVRACLDGLLETTLEARRDAGSPAAPADDLVHAYLAAFWLRPETALTQAVEARLLGPIFAGAGGPLLDVGCGDGIHTSLVLGWRFDELFDAFQQVDPGRADLFDATPAGLEVAVTRRGRPIDCGVDVKASSVARARALGTFRETREADATALPFPGGSFATVHSNAVANLEDRVLEAILAECARVLRPGGLLVLVSAAEGYEDGLYFHPRARRLQAEGREAEAARFRRLDRGRSGPLIRWRSLESWSRRLEAAGLTYEGGHTYLSPTLLRFWDTGLRPFAPLLATWAESLRHRDGFAEVKRGLVAAMEAVLGPLGAEGERPDGTHRIVRARKR
jgi:SAM-dependent methyltransferase